MPADDHFAHLEYVHLNKMMTPTGAITVYLLLEVGRFGAHCTMK